MDDDPLKEWNPVFIVLRATVNRLFRIRRKTRGVGGSKDLKSRRPFRVRRHCYTWNIYVYIYHERMSYVITYKSRFRCSLPLSIMSHEPLSIIRVSSPPSFEFHNCKTYWKLFMKIMANQTAKTLYHLSTILLSIDKTSHYPIGHQKIVNIVIDIWISTIIHEFDFNVWV